MVLPLWEGTLLLFKPWTHGFFTSYYYSTELCKSATGVNLASITLSFICLLSIFKLPILCVLCVCGRACLCAGMWLWECIAAIYSGWTVAKAISMAVALYIIQHGVIFDCRDTKQLLPEWGIQSEMRPRSRRRHDECQLRPDGGEDSVYQEELRIRRLRIQCTRGSRSLLLREEIVWDPDTKLVDRQGPGRRRGSGQSHLPKRLQELPAGRLPLCWR